MPETDSDGPLGPFDEEWVRAAPNMEQSADERIQRYRQIDSGHRLAQEQPWRTSGGPPRPDGGGLSLARWVIALAGIAGGIVLVVWLFGLGRPLVDDGPTAYLGDDTARQGPGTTSARELGPGQTPPPGADAQPRRILPAVQSPSDAGEFSFLAEAGGRPITYSPCRRLEVVVNTTGAPPGAYEAVTETVAQIGAASGLSLSVTGDTDEEYRPDRDPHQPQRYGDRWAPILVTWTPAAEVPEFAGNAVGLGGSLSVDPGPGPPSYVTGEITVNRDYFAVPTTAGLLREVLLHEFGHVVGLGHVDDAEQLMTPEARGGRPLGSGDRAGLALLGRGPCTPDL